MEQLWEAEERAREGVRMPLHLLLLVGMMRGSHHQTRSAALVTTGVKGRRNDCLANHDTRENNILARDKQFIELLHSSMEYKR
jgi:hypothetical protein